MFRNIWENTTQKVLNGRLKGEVVLGLVAIQFLEYRGSSGQQKADLSKRADDEITI